MTDPTQDTEQKTSPVYEPRGSPHPWVLLSLLPIPLQFVIFWGPPPGKEAVPEVCRLLSVELWGVSATPQLGSSQMFLSMLVSEEKLRPVVPN